MLIEISALPQAKALEGCAREFGVLECLEQLWLYVSVGSGLELVVYADAAYASKGTKGQSASGGAVMRRGAAIQWISRAQRCTTLLE